MTKQTDPTWGTPPKRIKDAYCAQGFSKAGSFGPREAGSTFAFAMILQPIILSTSFAIEQFAEQSSPMQSGPIVFCAAYFSQMFVAIALKVFASILRNFGASIVRDFGAWVWLHLVAAVGSSIWDAMFGWLPGRRRRPFRPDPSPAPSPSPDGDTAPSRPILDWLFPRRRK